MKRQPPIKTAIHREEFFRVVPVKKSVSVRIDADVLAWLKAQGPGYQTRINEILRAAMMKDQTMSRRRVIEASAAKHSTFNPQE